MSFDVFVQRFVGGDPVAADATTVRGMLEPFVDGVEDDFARLRARDGQADLYGWDDLDSGFLVNHISGVAILDLIVRVAAAAQLTIIPVGCPTAVASLDQVPDLPDDLRDDVILVNCGSDLLAASRRV